MAHALSIRPAARVRNLSVAFLVAWFLLALGGSLLGGFDSDPGPPIPLGLMAVAPVALFVAVYLASAPFRQFVSMLDVRLLTLLQTWRVGGIMFVILYWQGKLPGVFALPAGWGDFAIGITAPIVAWLWKPPQFNRTFLAWNILGSLDLVLAVTLGVLSSTSSIGLLAGEVTTRPMGFFPLSLIPTFFVPVLLILHLINLTHVRSEVRS